MYFSHEKPTEHNILTQNTNRRVQIWLIECQATCILARAIISGELRWNIDDCYIVW